MKGRKRKERQTKEFKNQRGAVDRIEQSEINIYFQVFGMSSSYVNSGIYACSCPLSN